MKTDLKSGQQVASAASSYHSLVVSDVVRLTQDSVSVAFIVPEALRTTFSFAPGQSVALRRVTDTVEHRRNYSIVGATREGFRVGVREVAGGHFSPWLVRDVRPGDSIDVFPPQGRFFIHPEDKGRHLCIAAGSGITPILAIASSVLSSGDGDVTLVYGNRTPASVMFAEELEDLAARYQHRFTTLQTFSRQGRTPGESPFRLDAPGLQKALGRLAPAIEYDHIWICGPFEMAVGARDLLLGNGVAPSAVRLELFSTDGAPVDTPPVGEEGHTGESTVVATLGGQNNTYVQSGDVTLLQGLEAARDDAPFSCRSGVCGTCRVLVRKGRVDMRENYALDPDEIEDGYVLACQSYPADKAIQLDFDS
ncbi:2Fe-2S iron-sulfur cluster-binding protein [Paenarthrobacter sp. NPDC057981]|uniref:2Fe-2S iron-sulfur cluster-binding protein n=1 Tax=Paenarthrobacter sp. NPDC057981 TaxID=3346297 RepID=UPI0036DEECBF